MSVSIRQGCKKPTRGERRESGGGERGRVDTNQLRWTVGVPWREALKSELIGDLDSVGRGESCCLCFVMVDVKSGHLDGTQSAELQEGSHTGRQHIAAVWLKNCVLSLHQKINKKITASRGRSLGVHP